MRRLMVEAMGDPHKDLEEMTQVSPLFQHASLGAPVMIVHGRDDLRVDYEHARRLARMLSLGGKPPVGLVFDKEGHGFSDMDNIQAMWEGVAGFLRQHLGGGGATEVAAAPWRPGLPSGRPALPIPEGGVTSTFPARHEVPTWRLS